jgi:hypothetical protein
MTILNLHTFCFTQPHSLAQLSSKKQWMGGRTGEHSPQVSLRKHPALSYQPLTPGALSISHRNKLNGEHSRNNSDERRKQEEQVGSWTGCACHKRFSQSIGSSGGEMLLWTIPSEGKELCFPVPTSTNWIQVALRESEWDWVRLLPSARAGYRESTAGIH